MKEPNNTQKPDNRLMPQEAAEAEKLIGTCEVDSGAVQPGVKQPFFTVDKMVKLAMFTAIATVLYLLDFQIFPTVFWLKLDFSEVISFFVAFMYGPIEGVIVVVLKILLKVLIKGSQFPIGELAVLVVGLSFILPASFIYKRHKSIQGAVVALAVSSVVMIVVAGLNNMFVMLPLFGKPEWAFDPTIIGFTALFNLIKAVATSVIVFLTYKPLHKLLNKVVTQ